MEIKTFTFVDDPNAAEDSPWRTEDYNVLYRPNGPLASEAYVIHPEEAMSWVIYRNEIDRYMEMLTWMKEHQASLAEPSTEDRTDPAGSGAPLDDPNPVEEEG